MNKDIFKNENISGIVNILPQRKDIFKDEDVGGIIPKRKERKPKEISQPLISEEKEKEIKEKFKSTWGFEPVQELKETAKAPTLLEAKLPIDIKKRFQDFYLASRQTIHRGAQFTRSVLPHMVFEEVDPLKYGRKTGISIDTLRKRNKEFRRIKSGYKKKYEVAQRKFEQWEKAHPELKPRPEWQRPALDIIKENPEVLLDFNFMTHIIARNAPFTVGAIGAAVGVTAVTKNPIMGLAAAVGITTPVEGQSVYEGIMEEWKRQGVKITPEREQKAAQIAAPVGLLCGLVEVASDLPLLSAISKPFANLFRKTLSRTLGKKVASIAVKRGIGRFGLIMLAENAEEIIQDASINVAIDMTTKGRPILESVADTLKRSPEILTETSISMLPWAGLGMGGEMRQTFQAREQATKKAVIEDIEKKVEEKVVEPEKPVVTPARKDVREMTKEEALVELEEIKEEVKDLDSRVTTSATLNKSTKERYEGSPELLAERDALKARELELIPKAYPETAEKVRPEVAEPPVVPPVEEPILAINGAGLEKPEVPTRVPLEEITPEQAQSELTQRKAGLKFPDETEQEAKRRIDALEFYAKPIVEEEAPPTVEKPEVIKVEEVKPGVPRGWKIIQDAQLLKRYKTYEGTLEIDIAQNVPKDGLRKFTFKIRKLGRKIEIRAKSLEEAIKKYKDKTGAVEIWEGAEARRLERYEINRVVEDLEMTAFKTPPTDEDMKRSLENVVGTLSKEEMDVAIADVKAYMEKPTLESTERINDGGREIDENNFEEEYRYLQRLKNKIEEGIATEEEKRLYEEKICNAAERIAEHSVPSSEEVGFEDEELNTKWRLAAAKNSINTLFGLFPKGINFYLSWSENSAWALKNLPGQRQTQHQKAFWIVRRMKKAGKKYGFTKEDYIRTFWYANRRALLKELSKEEQARFREVLEINDEVFTGELKEAKRRGILKEGFMQRVVREINEELIHERVALKTDKTAEDKLARKESIRSLGEELEFIKKMDIRYVHLPVKMLFQDLYKDEDIRKSLRFNRFFRRRETVDVVAWIEELLKQTYVKKERVTVKLRKEIKEGKAKIVRGELTRGDEVIVRRPVLNRDKLDIRRVVATYYDKLGRLYGLADIVSAFNSDGFIKDKPAGAMPSGWTNLPSKFFKEFQGKIVKREVGDWLEDYLASAFRKGVEIHRVLAYFKLMQFTKLFFLPAYDVYQAGVLWGLRWFITKPHKWFKLFSAVKKSLIEKDEEYWNSWQYGAYSQPYSLSFQTFMNEIDIMLQETGYGKMLATLKQHKMFSPIDIPYMFIWNVNWGGDRFVRLITYHALRIEGHTPKEASNLTALAHSDYARVPASTRRVLNKIWFTPIFPITMAAFEFNMLKGGAQELIYQCQRGGAKLGLWKPPVISKKIMMRRRSLANSLLGWVGLACLKELIQRKLGYEPEVPLVSYKKVIDDPDNPGQKKELVKWIPTPMNVLLRYIFKWRRFPYTADKLKAFWTSFKSSAFPLWAWLLEVLMNRKRDFTPIAEWSSIVPGIGSKEDKAKFVLDQLAYMGERLIPLMKETLERLPGVETEAKRKRIQAIKEFRKAAPEILRIIEPMLFIYIRNTEDRRKKWQAKEIQRMIAGEARAAIKVGDKDISRFIERMRRLRDSLKNITEPETTKQKRVRKGKPWERIEENLEGLVE